MLCIPYWLVLCLIAPGLGVVLLVAFLVVVYSVQNIAVRFPGHRIHTPQPPPDAEEGVPWYPRS